MKQLLIAVCAILAFVLIGCNSIAADKEVALAKIVTIHEQLNNQDIEGIKSDISPMMLKDISMSGIEKMFTMIHTKLGKVKSSKNTKAMTGNIDSESAITLINDTIFEKGKGVETFTFHVKNGRATLLGYNIRIPDMKME